MLSELRSWRRQHHIAAKFANEIWLALEAQTVTLPAAETWGQVVGELRDKAILAILVSLFAIVMYIRVRFAEYSYGIAAVVAVIHDVLITLGVLSIFMWTGWVQV